MTKQVAAGAFDVLLAHLVIRLQKVSRKAIVF